MGIIRGRVKQLQRVVGNFSFIKYERLETGYFCIGLYHATRIAEKIEILKCSMKNVLLAALRMFFLGKN